MESKEGDPSFREPTPYKIKSLVRESGGNRLGTIVEDSAYEDLFLNPLPKAGERSACDSFSKRSSKDYQNKPVEETTPSSSPSHSHKVTTPPAVLKERIKATEINYAKLKRDYQELSEFTTYEVQMLKADKGYYEKCAENENLQSQVGELNNTIKIQEELINSLEHQLENSKSDYDLLQKENKKVKKEFSVIENKLVEEGLKWEVAETKWKSREEELKKSLEEAWSSIKIKDDRLNLLKDKIRELNERDTYKRKGTNLFQDKDEPDKFQRQEEQFGDLSTLCAELSVIFDSDTSNKKFELREEVESRKYVEEIAKDFQERLKEQNEVIKELQMKLVNVQSSFATDLQDATCQTEFSSDNLLQDQYLNKDLNDKVQNTLDCTKLIDFDATITHNEQSELISKPTTTGNVIQELSYLQTAERFNDDYKNENELLHKEIAHYKCVIDDKDRIITRLEDEFKKLSLTENKEHHGITDNKSLEHFNSLTDFTTILNDFNNNIDKISKKFINKFNEKSNKLIALELKVKNIFNVFKNFKDTHSVISNDLEISLNNMKDVIFKMNGEIENSGIYLKDKLSVKVEKLEKLDSLLSDFWRMHQEKHFIKPTNFTSVIGANLNRSLGSKAHADATVYFSSDSKAVDMDFTLLPSSNPSNQTIIRSEDIIPESDCLQLTTSEGNNQQSACIDYDSNLFDFNRQDKTNISMIDQSVQVDIITFDNIEALKDKIQEQASIIIAKESETLNLLNEMENYKQDNFKHFKERIDNITIKLNIFESDLENSLLNKEKTVTKLEENLNSIRATLNDSVILSHVDFQALQADRCEKVNSFASDQFINMRNKIETLLNSFNLLEEQFNSRISHEVNKLVNLKDYVCIIGNTIKHEHVNLSESIINASISPLSSVPQHASISASESPEDTVNNSLEISNIPSSLSLDSISPNSSDTLNLENTALNKELMEAGYFNKNSSNKHYPIIEDSNESLFEEETTQSNYLLKEKECINQSLDYTCASIKEPVEENVFANITKILCDKVYNFMKEIDKKDKEFNNKINQRLNVVNNIESRVNELSGKLLKAPGENNTCTCQQKRNAPCVDTLSEPDSVKTISNEDLEAEVEPMKSKLNETNHISKLESDIQMLEEKLQEQKVVIDNKNEEIKNVSEEMDTFKQKQCDNILTKFEEMLCELSNIEIRLNSNLEIKLKSVKKLEDLVSTKLEEKHLVNSLKKNVVELKEKIFEKDVMLQAKDDEMKNSTQEVESFIKNLWENVINEIENLFAEVTNTGNRLSSNLQSKLETLVKLEHRILLLKSKLKEQDTTLKLKDDEIKNLSENLESFKKQECENILTKIQEMFSKMLNLESKINSDLTSKFQSIINLEEIVASKLVEKNEIPSLNNEIQILKEKLEEQVSLVQAKDEELKKTQDFDSFKRQECKIQEMFSEIANLELNLNNDLASKFQSIINLEEIVASKLKEKHEISTLNNEIQILKEKLEEQVSLVQAKDEELKKTQDLNSLKSQECKIQEMFSEMANLESKLNNDLASKFQSIINLEEVVASKLKEKHEISSLNNEIQILKEKVVEQDSIIQDKDEEIKKKSHELEFQQQECEKLLSEVHKMFNEISNLESRLSTFESKIHSVTKLEEIVSSKFQEKYLISSLNNEIQMLKEKLEEQVSLVQVKDEEIRQTSQDAESFKQKECENVLSKVEEMVNDISNLEIKINNELESKLQSIKSLEELVSSRSEQKNNEIQILKEKLKEQDSIILAKDEAILKVSQDLESFKKEECENVLSKVQEMSSEISNLESRLNNSLESKLQSVVNLEDLVASTLREKLEESTLKNKIQILEEKLKEQCLQIQTKDEEIRNTQQELQVYKQFELNDVLAEVKELFGEMANFEMKVNNDLQLKQTLLVKMEERVTSLTNSFNEINTSRKSNEVMCKPDKSLLCNSKNVLPGAGNTSLLCMSVYCESPGEKTVAFDNTEVYIDEEPSLICEDSNETNIFTEKSVFFTDVYQQADRSIDDDPFKESVMEKTLGYQQADRSFDVDPFKESIMEKTLTDNDDSDSCSDFGTPLAQHLEENNIETDFSARIASKGRLFSDNFTEDSLLNFASKIRDTLSALIDDNDLNNESVQNSNAQLFLQNICLEKVSEENQKLLKEVENAKVKADKCEQAEISLEELENKIALFIEIANPLVEDSSNIGVNTKLTAQLDDIIIKIRSLTETLQHQFATSEKGFLDSVETMYNKYTDLNGVNELLNKVTLENDQLKEELFTCKVINDQLSDMDSLLQALANDFNILREAYNNNIDESHLVDLILSFKNLVSPKENLPKNIDIFNATDILQQIFEDFKYVSNLLKEFTTSNSGLRDIIQNLYNANLAFKNSQENSVKSENIESLYCQIKNIKVEVSDLSEFGTSFKLEITKILNTLQNELIKFIQKNKDLTLEINDIKKELIGRNRENEEFQQNNELLSKNFTDVINKLKNDLKEKEDTISALQCESNDNKSYASNTLQSFNKLQTEHQNLLTNMKDIQFNLEQTLRCKNKIFDITKLLNINIEVSENDVNYLLSNLNSLHDAVSDTVLKKNDLEVKLNELKTSHEDILSYLQNLKAEQQEFKLKEDERFNNLLTQYKQVQTEMEKLRNEFGEQNNVLSELSKYKNTIVEINKLFNIEGNDLDSELNVLQTNIKNIVTQRHDLNLQFNELKLSYDNLLSETKLIKKVQIENEKTAEYCKNIVKEMENLREKYNDQCKSLDYLSNIKTLITNMIKLFQTENYSTVSLDKSDLCSLTLALETLVNELIAQKLQVQEKCDNQLETLKHVSDVNNIIIKINKLFDEDFNETNDDFAQINKNCCIIYNFANDLMKSKEELREQNDELLRFQNEHKNFQNKFLNQIKDIIIKGYKLFNEEFNYTEDSIDNFIPHLKKLFDLMDEAITAKKELSETNHNKLDCEERILKIKRGLLDILNIFNKKIIDDQNDEIECLKILNSRVSELFKEYNILKHDLEVFNSEIECLKQFVGCDDSSAEFSVWDNIKNRIRFMKEGTSYNRYDLGELQEKMNKLESDLLDAEGVKRQLAVELHGMDPMQSVYDLMKIPPKELYVTFMKTLMKKEELLIGDIQNDYEAKLTDLKENINQLREEEKRKLDWISQLENENEKLADECKNKIKSSEILTDNIEVPEVSNESVVVEELTKETVTSECVKCKNYENNEQKLNSDYVHCVEQLEEKQINIKHLNNVITEKTNFIYKLEESQSEKETKIMELLSVINKKQELIEDLQHKLNDLFPKISSLEKSLTEVRTINEELNRNITTKNNNITELEDHIDTLKNKTNVINHYETEISEVNKQLSLVETELSEQKVKYEENISEKVKCINDLQVELESYKIKCLQMEHNLNSLDIMKKDLNEKQILIDELHEKVNTLSSKNISFEEKLSTESIANEQLRKEFDEIKNKYNNMSSKHIDSNCPHLKALEEAKNEIIELNKKNKDQLDNFLLVKHNLEEDIQYKLNMISELDTKLKTAIYNHKQAMMSKAEFCEKLERNLHEHKEKERRFDEKISIQRDMYMKEKKLVETELNNKIHIIDDLKETIKKLEAENNIQMKEMESKLKDQFESFSNEVQSKNKLIENLKEKLHLTETHNKEKLLLKRELSNKEIIINELKSKLDKTEQEIEKSYIELTSLKNKILELTDVKRDNIEDALKEIKIKVTESNEIIKQLEELKVTNKNLDEECDFLNSNIEHLENQIGVTYKWKEEEVDKVKTELLEERKKLEEISTIKIQLEHELAETKNKISTYESDLKHKDKSITDLQNQITDLYTKCSALEVKASQLLKSLEDLKKDKLQLTEEINNKNWKIGSLEIKLQEETKSLQQKQELLDDYKSKITKMKDESMRMKDKLNKIESNKEKQSMFAETKENANMSGSPSGRKLGEIRNVQIHQLEERIEKLEKDRKIFKTLSIHRQKKINELEKALNIHSSGVAPSSTTYGTP